VAGQAGSPSQGEPPKHLFDFGRFARNSDRTATGVRAISSTTKDIILAISPAFFGVVGTVLGARAANSGATAERRAKEDNAARACLTALTEVIASVERLSRDPSRYARDPSFEPLQLVARLPESASNARAPLLTAGLAYRTVYAGLMVFDFVAEELVEDPWRPAAHLDDANRVVFFFVELLDRGRRRRRSKRTLRRLKSQIRNTEFYGRVLLELDKTEPRRRWPW
jgi:hypothetical protein